MRGRYGRFMGLAGAVAVGLCAIGWVPTKRLAGAEATRAMIAGCAISLVSAALAGALLVAAPAETPQARMQRGFLAMIVRLVAVIVLASAAVLSGEFQRSPLLFWMATGYMALLPLEVRLAIL